jgi:hypothetical protein
VPADQAESHRVFKVELAAPPRMWSTHPANADREANAKRTYVRADIDQRSAWVLFKDPQALREIVSAHLAPKSDLTPVPPEVSLAKLEEQYARGFFNAQYRGAYLGRSVVRHASSTDELYGNLPTPERLRAELDALYPPTLSSELERLRNLEEERQMLIALREGLLTAPGGVIRHRGVAMSRKELPAAIEAVEREVNACAEAVRDHDRRCRASHLAAAKALGEDWGNYLKGLLDLLHYADHVEANLLDAHGVLSHTVAIATADGKVSGRELANIIHAADTAYAALKDVHEAVDQVIPDRTVLKRMQADSWRAALETLALPPPSKENIGDWLNAIGGWARSASSSLAALRLAALEQLLAAENQIAIFTRKGMKPAAAPPASVVPRSYRLLTPGSERPRNAKLTWWDRFQTTTGVFPTVARFATAAAIVGAVVLVASGVGSSTVHIFNGLERTVITRINETQTTVPAGAHVAVDVGQADQLHIVTTTTDGRQIEAFNEENAGRSVHEVYNVAGAGALVSWTAAYGNATAGAEQMLGAPRWSTTRADVIFEEPPVSVKIKGGGATRTVLMGIGNGVPEAVLGAIKDEAAQRIVAAAHARWDESSSRNVYQWLSFASALPEFPQILRDRLQAEPNDPVNLRWEQDTTTGEAHEAVCERHRRMAAAAPNDANLQYSSVRCLSNSAERDQAFLALYERWPDNGWLAQAAGHIYAGEADWNRALASLERASERLPAMREYLAIDSARIRRVLANSTAADLRKMQAQSEYVRGLLAPETDEGARNESLAAYVSLVQGQLDKALAAQKDSAREQARVARLVAASDGASPMMIEHALNLPLDEGLDADTFVPTLSLAARTGRDASALMEQAAKVFPQDADQLLKAFTAIRNRADRAEVERALRGLEPRIRGQLYVAAAILGGPDCPREWRQAARQLLFATERPFLR